MTNVMTKHAPFYTRFNANSKGTVSHFHKWYIIPLLMVREGRERAPIQIPPSIYGEKNAKTHSNPKFTVNLR